MALLVLAAAAARAEMVLERAELFVSTVAAIPPDDAAWQPVTLPHAWLLDERLASGAAWYRLRFEWTGAPPQRIYLVRSIVSDMIVHLNGERLWRHRDVAPTAGTVAPVFIGVPAKLVREGENVIHLQVRGSGRATHGVARLYLGSGVEIAERAGLRQVYQGSMIVALAFASGLAGLLTLVLWMSERRDAVLFWYAMTGLGLFAVTAAWQFTLWRQDFAAERAALVFMRFIGFLTPLFVLHLRLLGRRMPWLEGLLWLVLAAAVGSQVARHEWSAELFAAWNLFYSVLPFGFFVMLVLARELQRTATIRLLMLADLAAVALSLHDWAVRAGLLAWDRPYLIYFVTPFILLAAGATLVQRHVEGVRALRRSNLELEDRVREKARELEANHRRVRDAEGARALTAERRRIMADMHDGLGSRLVALLSLAQSGRATAPEMREGLAAALDDLRLAIDALEPVEGDIGVVLGNVRHRMRSVFERAGVQFVWNVGELPCMDDLTPAKVLAIQRVLLEVFTNALKHAGASTVTVGTARVDGAVRIFIQDDGMGFDAAAAQANGRGLQNLRLRAGQAGGTIAVAASPNAGTRVTLELPIREAA